MEASDGRVNSTVATDTLVGLASLVLNDNYFEFNGKIYRQKQGAGIGMKFAPAYHHHHHHQIIFLHETLSAT